MDRTTAKYLLRSASSFSRPLIAGDIAGVEQVVVIPALAEERHVFSTLDCLEAQPAEEIARTLVVTVVNNRRPGHARDDEIADNRRTLEALGHRMGGTGRLRLGLIDASSPGCELGPRMGVGDARRIGLDHGLKVLVDNQAAHGLLISLDGDSRVETTYLATIRDHFETAKAHAAVVDYAHRLDGSPDEVDAAVSYELFLRYHSIGLEWAGSAYAYPAIGSTMVCRADAYVAVGGMNRRQAAEDFYFLQQLQKTGGVDVIRGTRVMPSCRPSHRVPFGTGATIARLLRDGVNTYRIYNAGTYCVLRQWLELLNAHLGQSASEVLAEADSLYQGLRSHLESRGLARAWENLHRHAATEDQLRAQVHRWFDGFETLKMIHFLRDNGHPNQTLEEAWTDAGRRWSVSIPPIDGSELDQRIEVLEVLRQETAVVLSAKDRR